MLRKGVKIYKFINQKSALDISHNLNYYKDKPQKDEKEYKGNIVVSITSGGKYLKAYISKVKARSLFQSIIDGNFSKLYPDGFIDYGGSNRDGQIVARTLKIERKVNQMKDRQGNVMLDSNGKPKLKVQMVFTISEGPGEMTQTGAFKIKRGAKSSTMVQSYLDSMSMRECALEVVGYIQSAEIAAQIIGQPLHTFMSVSNEKENEIGLQNLITSNNGAMSSLNDLSKLSNDDFRKLRQAVEVEYFRRVEAYKKAN